jgi:hypothetical protein
MSEFAVVIAAIGIAVAVVVLVLFREVCRFIMEALPQYRDVSKDDDDCD